MSLDSSSTTQSRKRTANEAKLDNFKDICELDLELKEFECPRCDKSFANRTDLFAHMRKLYKTPSICHICNKQLNALPNVLSHSYIHKNMKPYKCIKKDCKYQSRTRFNLKVHLASCAGIEKFKAHKRSRKKRAKVENRHSVYNSESSKDSSILMNFGIMNPLPNEDILTEVHNSGPYLKGKRDETFLIMIHKDYIPPKFTPLDITNPFGFFGYNYCPPLPLPLPIEPSLFPPLPLTDYPYFESEMDYVPPSVYPLEFELDTCKTEVKVDCDFFNVIGS